MFVDFVLDGRGHGKAGQILEGVRYDPGLLRPYFDGKGRRCVTVNTGRLRDNPDTGKPEPVYEKVMIGDLLNKGIYSPVFNATSLRKEEWIELDRVVVRAARERLRAWSDLASASSFGGFNAMSRMTLEYEVMSDPGEAQVDMSGLTRGRNDMPLFKLRSTPLPITHMDFSFDSRRLAVSRNGGTPLDTTLAEAAGRRVAEMIEKTVIGVSGGFSGFAYGGQTTGVTAHDTSGSLGASTVYGYTTFPHRSTKTDMTVPLGTNPDSTVADVLTMRNTLYGNKFYGPYMLYHSTDWDRFLDDDYVKGTAASGLASPGTTLRDRLRKIEGVQDVRRLDFFTSTFSMVMVEMTSQVARAINGMDITTVQWESEGGMQLNFKVMAIQVPQLRSDYNNATGILHGSTA